MADRAERQVIDNIRKALDNLVTKAERAHEAEMERINDEGLEGEARAKAIEAADEKLKQARTRQRRNRAARLKTMRQEFEANRMAGPYFPLSRFGNYFVTVRDGNGKVISFSRFEKAGEQRRFAEEMQAIEGQKVESGVASAKGEMEKSIDPKFVGEVEARLANAGAPEAVRDAVWQKYLETLPDFSMRKARIHRKNRAGFNTDAMRAFASNMFHGAHQLARLTYGQDLQQMIDDARSEVRTAADPVRAGALVNEMVQRHDFVMNPTTAPWSHWATSATFIWTMGGNISSALVNLDQTFTKGIPYLAYDEQIKPGMKAASAAILGAVRDFGAGKGSALQSERLSPDERMALSAGYDMGVIDRTQAHDVAGVAESGVSYNPMRAKVMRLLSWPMHQTERFNREVTFLAAYRLARASGLEQPRAIAKASDLTWMTHFDNQSTSKPRIMQGDIGRVAFALRGFQANILFRLFRDMHQAMKAKRLTPSAPRLVG